MEEKQGGQAAPDRVHIEVFKEVRDRLAILATALRVPQYQVGSELLDRAISQEIESRGLPGFVFPKGLDEEQV